MSNTAQQTFTNQKLEPYYLQPAPVEMAVKLPASVTYARGTLLGELTATPGTFAAYASGNSDGSQFIKAILAFDTTTDGSGNATISGPTVTGILPVAQSVPAYFRGVFRCEDLVQSGAGAITSGSITGTPLRQINGTSAAGVVELI
jgi:hypothetical protein